MELYGFALLPDTDTQERLVEFARRHADALAEPVPDMSDNVPHTTLLRCPYEAGVDYGAFLSLAEGVVGSTWTKLYHQPRGWAFAGVARTYRLGELQRRLLEATRDHIDAAVIPSHADPSALTGSELENHARYGYRYVGDCYRPHVTLGRVANGSDRVAGSAVRAFDGVFSGRVVRYDRIVFYRAGEFGSVADVLSERVLG